MTQSVEVDVPVKPARGGAEGEKRKRGRPRKIPANVASPDTPDVPVCETEDVNPTHITEAAEEEMPDPVVGSAQEEAEGEGNEGSDIDMQDQYATVKMSMNMWRAR